MKLLVVDDEQDLQEILRFNLEIEGYEVDTVSSAEEALAMDLRQYSLILLDVMMGGMSGFQMATSMKSNPLLSHIPIIFITALDGENDMVRGLNIGGDDYIAKPLSMVEVKARVKAVLRRSTRVVPTEVSDTRKQVVSYETLSLDIGTKVAMLEGVPLQLTKLEFSLLQLFLSNPGKLYSREDLMQLCWPEDVYVQDRTVDVSITRLRKKISPYGKNIKTRFGYGYVFE